MLRFALLKKHIYFISLFSILLCSLIFGLSLNLRLRSKRSQSITEARDPLCPMIGKTLQGALYTIDYALPQTVIFLFHQPLQPGPLLELWNRISQYMQAEHTAVIGVCIGTNSPPPLMAGLASFPIIYDVKMALMYTNGLNHSPMTLVVSKGGHVQGMWFGIPEGTSRIALWNVLDSSRKYK